MSAILIPERRIRRNYKPDFPVRLREGGFPRPNALTLLRDVADQKYFDVARDDWYTISSAGLVARPTPFGLGVHNTGTSSIYLGSWPSIGLDIDAVSGITAILVLDYRQALTGSAYERYWPHHVSSNGACGVFLDSSGFRYTVRNLPVSAINPASYGLQVVVMRISDANGQQFWRNGVLDYDASLSTFWSTAASGAQIYSSGAEAQASSNSLLAMGYWAQDLGPSFCQALSAEGLPMLLRPKRRAIWVPMGGAASVDLAGNAAAQAAAAAALTHAVPLAGAGLSVATATGALSVSIPLAAAAQSQAAASATLTTSGSAALAGNATAQANATGGLGLTVPLSGAAVAQALAQAGITHSVPLAGAASGQAGASGALTLNISLSGTAISQAAASAGLTVLGASDLAGNATAQAAASAALTHAVPLSGASVVVGNASGSLSQIVPVAGAAASASMATGGLDVAVSLSAAALAQALAAAGLTVTASGLAGAAAADASAGGTLTLRVNLEGAAIANAIASGALSTAGLILAGTPGYTVTRNRRDYSVSRTPRTWRISA